MDFCYTLKDFEVIGNKENVLSPETLNIIKKLCEIVGVPTETTTYVNQYNNNNSAATNHNNKQSKDTEYRGDKFYKAKRAQKTGGDGWKNSSGFKVSKFADLNNNDAIISEIRTLMNKLTAANQSSKIVSIREKFVELQDVLEDSDDKSDLIKALSTIYTITVSNTSYMDTYINVWNNLFADFQQEIDELLLSKIDDYKESLNNIIDVDSKNYDEFCDFTAKNTTRTNTTHFLGKLVNSEVSTFSRDNLISLLDMMTKQIEAAIETKERQTEVEQLTENVVIIFSTLRAGTDASVFENYLPWLKQITSYKTGEKPGLPPRSKFKYMDLIGK